MQKKKTSSPAELKWKGSPLATHRLDYFLLLFYCDYIKGNNRQLTRSSSSSHLSKKKKRKNNNRECT